MRDKERKQDYRFMPEPNLPPLVLDTNIINYEKVNNNSWFVCGGGGGGVLLIVFTKIIIKSKLIWKYLFYLAVLLPLRLI